MEKEKPFRISAIVQGVYSIVCLINVVLCLVYANAYHTESGRFCAELSLHLTFLLFIIPAMPISTALNIGTMPSKKADPTRYTRRLLWTILSPILYVVTWLITLCVWMSTTGGV